jgi:hypothetical protein
MVSSKVAPNLELLLNITVFSDRKVGVMKGDTNQLLLIPKVVMLHLGLKACL